MRIAADDHLYHLLRCAGRDVEVFCDGVKQSDAVMAAEEAGEVLCCSIDGPIMRRGKVQIEIVRSVPCNPAPTAEKQ